MAGARRKRKIAPPLWALVAVVAVLELGADAWIRAAVPTESSWDKAATFVRERFGSRDRIVAAPSWIDPIVRFHLGDLLTLRSAAPPNRAGFDRIWEVSIRGASTRSDPPDLEAQLEGVRVRMWELPADEVRYDFVEQIAHAQAALVDGERSEPCPWMEAASGPGGLGRGPMPPPRRFVCDRTRPWLWVGPTILADLELEPRRCIWQHPAGADPVVVTFFDVPLGDRLIVHGGIDYNSERERTHGPVTLRVWIGDRLAGELIHHDGDGWSKLEIETSALGLDRSDVRFETTAVDPTARTFCWSALSTITQASNE